MRHFKDVLYLHSLLFIIFVYVVARKIRVEQAMYLSDRKPIPSTDSACGRPEFRRPPYVGSQKGNASSRMRRPEVPHHLEVGRCFQQRSPSWSSARSVEGHSQRSQMITCSSRLALRDLVSSFTNPPPPPLRIVHLLYACCSANEEEVPQIQHCLSR